MEKDNLNETSANSNIENKSNLLQILNTIGKVSQLIDEFYDRFYKEFKLTRVQFRTLYFLYLKGEEGLTISDLSEKLNVAKPTTTNLVSRMESNGLVERISNKEDRRLVIILLTVKGEEIINKVLPSDEEFKLSILDFLTEEERDRLGKLMNLIEKELKSKLFKG